LEGSDRQAVPVGEILREAQGNESLARAELPKLLGSRQLADTYREEMLKAEEAEEQAKRDAEAAPNS